MSEFQSAMERLWDLGQQHLAAGQYGAARRELETAEGLAWRQMNAAALARIYLPLMEVRRLMRLQAVEGVLLIGPGGAGLKAILSAAAGTAVVGGTLAERSAAAEAIGYAARRRGCALETLWLIRVGRETRAVSPQKGTFAAGVPVRIAAADSESIDPTAAGEFVAGRNPNFAAPLPRAGVYDPQDPAARAPHAMARESLLVLWESLALRWQARHPLKSAGVSPDAAWREMAWLRETLRVDPACEPAAMRMMALAEAVARGG